MSDFGLRRLDAESGQLSKIVWLSDFVGSKESPKTPKKLLLLNFYATWCKPCIAELPILVGLQKQYGAAGLQVLSVNFRMQSEPLADVIERTVKLMRAHKLNFPVLFDRYTNRNQLIYLGSKATLPCNILIDARGVVVKRLQGGAGSTLVELEKAVTRHLGTTVSP